MNTLRELIIGTLASAIRQSIVAGFTWLVTCHPAVAKLLAPLGNTLLVQAAAVFVAVVLVALFSAWMRWLRHSKLFDEAFQAGMDAARGVVRNAVTQDAGLDETQPSRMKGSSVMGLLLVCGLLAAGCISSDHVMHIHGEGAGAEVIPQAGLVRLGYGNFVFDQSTVKAGQGVVVRMDQYGLTSTNILSSQIFAVLPYNDSIVKIEQQRKALFSLLGFSIDNPFSNSVTTVEVTPNK